MRDTGTHFQSASMSPHSNYARAAACVSNMQKSRNCLFVKDAGLLLDDKIFFGHKYKQKGA